jgi:20S proteasome alpha/beta subunit
MSIEEAAELARRSIYHATFRDGASGGVASGTLYLSLNNYLIHLEYASSLS